MPLRKRTLSPRDLAHVVGVSESSLKRWADDGLLQISRTAGGHRRIELAEAAAYLRRSGLPLNNPEPLGFANLTTLVDGVAPGRLDFLLVDAIQRCDQARACGLTLKLYLSGRSVCEICDGPMKHALRHDPVAGMSRPPATNDAREIEICLAALDQLTDLLPPAHDRSTAVLVADATPLNAITARMMNTVLTAERWQIDDGTLTNLPETARERNANLVAIPAGMLQSTPTVLEEIAHALQHSACRMVLVGVLNACPSNISVVESMSEFASLVRCVEAIDSGPLN